MPYDHSSIFAQIEKIMSGKPKITIGQLAVSLNIGMRTIRRVIRETTGKSFREYQKLRILNRTKSLLASEPGLLKKQIAAKVGYRSSDSLSRFIRRSQRSALTQ
jgi:transcriptional regulator GlxA family with amidase domain